MPPGKVTSTKKFAVRMSLVTGSTLAVIVGAQSLASLDKKMFSASDVSSPTVSDPALQPNNTGLPPASRPVIQPIAPAMTTGQTVGTVPTISEGPVVRAAPVITILRQPGQVSAAPANATTTSATTIRPPQPVQLAAPDPVIVQAPGEQIFVQSSAPAAPASQPVTRSSR